MYKTTYIKDIFYTGSYAHKVDDQLIVDITFLLNSKLLFIEKKEISNLAKYYQYQDDIISGKEKVSDIVGGSNGHMALKLIGRDYLINLGFKKVIYEKNLNGYFPDAMSPDEKIIIECGNTNPDKVFNYFKNINLEQLVVIPYPSNEQDDIKAIIFKPADNLAEFLVFREQEMSKQAFNLRTKRE